MSPAASEESPEAPKCSKYYPGASQCLQYPSKCLPDASQIPPDAFQTVPKHRNSLPFLKFPQITASPAFANVTAPARMRFRAFVHFRKLQKVLKSRNVGFWRNKQWKAKTATTRTGGQNWFLLESKVYRCPDIEMCRYPDIQKSGIRYQIY